MPTAPDRTHGMPDRLPADWPERCAQLATMVQIAVERGNWPQAHAELSRAEYELAAELAPRRAPADPRAMPVPSLVDVKSANALESIGIFTAGQLALASDARLLAIPGVGPKTLAAIDQALAALGLERGAA